MKKPPKANRRGALGGEVLFLGSICQKLTSPLITHFMGHASKMFALWCFVVLCGAFKGDYSGLFESCSLAHNARTSNEVVR